MVCKLSVVMADGTMAYAAGFLGINLLAGPVG